jgi:hypothetical protein
LLRGDYTDEVEVAAVPEEVAAEPTPTPTHTPKTSELKTQMLGFWSWVKAAIQTPSRQQETYKREYGWVTIGLLLFFGSLAATLGLHYVAGQLVVQSPLDGRYPSDLIDYSAYANPIGFWSFLAMIGIGLIVLMIAVFATQVGLRLLKQKVDFFQILDRLVASWLPAVIAFVLASVFMLVRLYFLGVMLVWIAGILLAASIVYQIVTADNATGHDDYYVKLVAVLATFAVIVLATLVLSRIFLREILMTFFS